MATKNAIDAGKPIEVTSGGTGLATLTDHSPLIGSGTAAISDVTVGTTGLLFIGSTGADPFFDNSIDADFTFTSATAGTARVFTVENTDNTSSSSGALIELSSGGASAGDPTLDFDINFIGDKYIYIDNSDSDKLEIGSSQIEGHINFFTSGEMVRPIIPAFLAQIPDGGTVSNATGDGTIYSYVCGTEIFDQSNDYDIGTGQFTAPITGRYFFVAGVRLSNVVASSAEECTVYINTSNRRYRTGENRGSHLGDFEMICATFADMDASDVAYPQVQASGGTKDCGVLGYTDPVLTCFAGYLAC